MKIIHIGGAKGVGKSTLINNLTPGTDFSIIKYTVSALLFQLATELTSEFWTDLNDTKKAWIRERAADKLRTLSCDAIILDSHYVDIVEGKTNLLIPSEFEAVIDCHIIIEAKAEEILNRRNNDTSRKRRLDLDEIKKEIAEERDAAMQMAAKTQKPIFILQNENIETTLESIISIIRQL